MSGAGGAADITVAQVATTPGRFTGDTLRYTIAIRGQLLLAVLARGGEAHRLLIPHGARRSGSAAAITPRSALGLLHAFAFTVGVVTAWNEAAAPGVRTRLRGDASLTRQRARGIAAHAILARTEAAGALTRVGARAPKTELSCATGCTTAAAVDALFAVIPLAVRARVERAALGASACARVARGRLILTEAEDRVASTQPQSRHGHGRTTRTCGTSTHDACYCLNHSSEVLMSCVTWPASRVPSCRLKPTHTVLYDGPYRVMAD